MGLESRDDYEKHYPANEDFLSRNLVKKSWRCNEK